MSKSAISSLISILIAVALAAAVSIAGGSGGSTVGPVSTFALCAFIAFLINWVAFIPANAAKTERYYDLTGCITYLSVIAVALLFSAQLDARALIVAALVVVWSLRLGSFLFARISRDGKDDRFDDIKPNPWRFLVAWTIQALWVVLTAACALAVITGGNREPIGVIGALGVLIWIFGFAVEVIADQQKSKFKRDPQNAGRFISSGLWAWSRHPNYFGEMVLWFGIAVIALPALQGWQYITLISPLFVYLLIRYISGVNKLEQKADRKWADDAAYQAYKNKTSLLVLKPPK